jgi:hypothetical protein
MRATRATVGDDRAEVAQIKAHCQRWDLADGALCARQWLVINPCAGPMATAIGALPG